MNPTEHLLQSSRTEIRLQWIAIVCMAIGLVTSIYFHAHILKAERIDSEVTSYMHLNDKYHTLLFSLIHNDPDVFRKTGDESLHQNKYIMYELFELFFAINSLEKYFKTINKDVWRSWKKREEFLFSKPAIRYAWQSHLNYAKDIYEPAFVEHIQMVIAHATISEEHHGPHTEIVELQHYHDR